MPFRRLLCTKAQVCHFYPGEFVMSDGDIGQGMYIVRRGKVGFFELFNHSLFHMYVLFVLYYLIQGDVIPVVLCCPSLEQAMK